MYEILTRDELMKKGLYRETRTVALPATTLKAGNITATAQRGDIRAVGVLCAGGTDANYADVEFTLSDNGKSFNQKDNLLAYAPSYRFTKRTLTPILIRENGILSFSFDNTSAVALVVVIELYYYNPFNESQR